MMHVAWTKQSWPMYSKILHMQPLHDQFHPVSHDSSHSNSSSNNNNNQRPSLIEIVVRFFPLPVLSPFFADCSCRWLRNTSLSVSLSLSNVIRNDEETFAHWCHSHVLPLVARATGFSVFCFMPMNVNFNANYIYMLQNACLSFEPIEWTWMK